MSVITDVTLIIHMSLDDDILVSRISDFGEDDEFCLWPRQSPLAKIDCAMVAGGGKVFTTDIYAGSYNHLDIEGFIEHCKRVRAELDDDYSAWVVVIGYEHNDDLIFIEKKVAGGQNSVEVNE